MGTDPPGGNVAALVRVRCVTPPSPGDYLEQRSASASEQVAPPGMDQALAPQIPLAQQWSAPMVFDPTDALAVRHISANEGPAQIVIEVAEFSGELYNLWVTQQGCCDCAGEIDCCGEETRDEALRAVVRRRLCAANYGAAEDTRSPGAGAGDAVEELSER